MINETTINANKKNQFIKLESINVFLMNNEKTRKLNTLTINS